MEENEEEMMILQWKAKKVISELEKCKGSGTSMISLFVKPKTQLSAIQQMLQEELGAASHIKSRVNRQSVIDAIVCTKERLKLFRSVPENGLCVFCGIVNDEGSSGDENNGTSSGKIMKVAFEPMRRINKSSYKCDNVFHVEDLKSLMQSHESYGFIVMDGSCALFGFLSGAIRSVIHKFSVQLPKKHGKGGQSSVRFSRLRSEARQNYIRKVCEAAKDHFIDSSGLINVAGLVLAGSADFKNRLHKSDLFDQRLKKKILKIVDVCYGDIEGFHSAIKQSCECLGNLRYVKEKDLLELFFAEVSRDTGMVCFGMKNVLEALRLGIAEKVIVFENLEFQMQIEEGENSVDVIEWLTENYRSKGFKLELLSGNTEEGTMFQNGFGGIACFLRFKMDVNQIVVVERNVDSNDIDDFI